MVNVNKKYIDKELRKNAWSNFKMKIVVSETTDALITNLRAFLTINEMAVLEKRLAIPILLKRQLSYREIGRELDVSSTMISFVKRNLVKKPVVHKTYSSSLSRRKPKYKQHFLPPYKGA